jgi:transposase
MSGRVLLRQAGGEGRDLKKYIVELSADQRQELEALTSKGVASVRRVKRALILLAANTGDGDGDKDEVIAERVGVSAGTVARIRQRFVGEGLEAALSERPRSGKPRRFDGRQEAYTIALACSDPPAGHANWTLRLIAGRLVELDIVESISHHTVGRVLKKGASSPGSTRSGASPR